jgi:hypothetical protein
LSNNVADDIGGALFVFVIPVSSLTPILHVSSSTLSGNSSGGPGGIAIYTPQDAPFELDVENSTIAFNASNRTSCGGIGQVGYTAMIADLESTIVADNTGSGGVEYDVCTVDAAGSLIGANNLIMVSGLPVPPGTISEDPMLGPLQDNGGPTLTHALPPDSPAINHGSNIAALDFDQRGVGFARQVSAPDIGAFELQTVVDMIFANGFDGT